MPGPGARAFVGTRLWLLVFLTAMAPAASEAPIPSEAGGPAPVDRGAGPGRPARPPSARLVPGGVPTGGPDAYLEGVFGPAVAWPINPIHAAVLPDGRLLTYGTDTAGKEGASLVYDVWDPAQGTDAGAHLTLPNTTATDIFCSAQTVLAGTGEVLITGGDRTVGRVRNFSNNLTTVFSPATNAVRGGVAMTYRRWYATLATLSDGEVLVLGGRQDPGLPASVPELYTPGAGYRPLVGAASDDAFGAKAANWWYPRAFVTPSGRVLVIGHDGALFSVDATGLGTVTRLPQHTLPARVGLPAAAFAPGRILTLRSQARAVVVDATGVQPTVTPTGSVSQIRIWSTLTVLPDGKVVATGGSAVGNKLAGVAYGAETWDPATGRWTLGAAATKPRLYHSTAILLPDATVLTAGGGSPGPVVNLNAEIYYPPYLFASDGSGLPAHRPSITDAPDSVQYGQAFAAAVDGPVARVTLLRTGSITHSLDAENRFLELGFVQTGGQLAVTPPADPNLAPPGYYMLFALDASGVPSVARIVRLGG